MDEMDEVCSLKALPFGNTSKEPKTIRVVIFGK